MTPKKSNNLNQTMYDLTYEKTQDGWLISGQTFRCKDLIKSCGGIWQPDTKMWLLQEITKLKNEVSMQKTLNDLQLERLRQLHKKQRKIE